METVKIKDKRTDAVKIVKKSLASDYVGTGNFVIVEDVKPSKITLKEVKSEEK